MAILFLLIFFFPEIVIRADQVSKREENSFILDRPNLEGRIVFVVKLGGRNNSDLWVMNADGSNIRHLTDSPVNEIHPSISPDGLFVAFAHDGEGDWRIAVMEIETGRVINITGCCANQQNPDWGDNGFIAYDSDENGNRDIFMKNPWDPSNDETIVQITSDPADEKQPAWSKGARLIAYVSNKDTKPLNHIRVFDFADGNKDNWQNWQVTGQGDSPVFWRGEGPIYDSAVPGMPAIAYVQIKGKKPVIRWSTIYGASGGEISERTDGEGPPVVNPSFNFMDTNTIGFINPNKGRILELDIHGDKNERAEPIFPPRMSDPIMDFDWGSYGNTNSGRGQGYTQQGKDIFRNQEGNRNEPQDIRRNDNQGRAEDDRRQRERKERDEEDSRQRMKMEEERRSMELRQERDRMELEDERRKSQSEMRKQEMELEQQRQRESMEMESERRKQEDEDRQMRREMEQQRGQMNRESSRIDSSSLYPDGQPPNEIFKRCVGQAFGGPPPGDFGERWPTEEEFQIMIDAGCEPGRTFGNIYGDNPNFQRSYVRGVSRDQYECMVDNLNERSVEQFEMRDPRPDEMERIAACEGVAEVFGFEVYGDEDRGFFGKPKMGGIKTGGPGEMLQDPTMLAIAGLVVTVGATLLQMARGK